MIKRIAQACGFSAILLLPNYIDLTSSAGDSRMRFPSPLTKIALAQLVDLAIVAVIFAIVIALLCKLKSWPTIRWALVAVLPPFLFVRNLNVFPFEIPNAIVLALCLLWIALIALLIIRAPSFAARIARLGSAVLTGFAIFALVITFQLIHAALWRPGPQA